MSLKRVLLPLLLAGCDDGSFSFGSAKPDAGEVLSEEECDEVAPGEIVGPDCLSGTLTCGSSATNTTEGGESETLEVLREGEDGDWWGRSEHTRGLIKLLKGPSSSLAEDVDTLLAE